MRPRVPSIRTRRGVGFTVATASVMRSGMAWRGERRALQRAVMELDGLMGTVSSARMSWSEICASQQFRNRWVALDGCRYDDETKQPAEGTVIDADDDLAELCSRMKRENQHFCTILFCEAARARAASRH